MEKILVNKIQCLYCGDIIESVTRHDFKFCSCGKCSVDGGKDYLKRGFDGETPEDCYIELSETEEVDNGRD